MESKIPKLRKPTGAIANPAFPAVSSANERAAIRANLTQKAKFPLTRDIVNLLPGSDNRKRVASPEIPTNIMARAKLRRSRSHNDLKTQYHPLKKMQPTLPTIPSKSSAALALAATKSFPSRVGAASSSSTVNATSSKSFTSTKSSVAIAKSTILSKTAPTASKTTIASKTAVKRIPPYDYKSRFLNLMEKHNALKSKHDNMMEQMSDLDNLIETNAAAEQELITLRSESSNFAKEKESLLYQIKVLESRNGILTEILKEKETKLDEIKTDRDNKAERIKAFTKELNELKTNYENLQSDYEFCKNENETKTQDIVEYKEKLFLANMERKDLHNMVADLRGNIRVFCRVRPPLSNEGDRPLCSIQHIDETSLELSSADYGSSKTRIAKQEFSFDHVFHENTQQTDVFDLVSPLIQSALDGYNVCIFAYGQTGSGKTFTMDGTIDYLGVIPRTVELLFDSIHNYKRMGWTYTISATFLEIYNEIIYDLLNPNNRDLEIRMKNASSKTEIYVANATEQAITDAEHLRELMNIARMNRATAATTGNERSSRSHAVTQIQLVGTHMEKQEICTGTINLVDLAGSESPKTSQRMEETKNINRSLSELSNVIMALVEKHDHIPYRNSKLTHLLMPSLGGNSKTLMIANIAPFQDCLTESLKSLRFASTVNSCKLSKAKKNRVLNNINFSNSSN